MKAGIIGTGSIGGAVATGLAKAGFDITISRRGETRSAQLARDYSNITVAENQSVLDESDVIFVALNTDVAAVVIDDLAFRSDQIVISLMADMDLMALGRLVYPAHAQTIMIPFPSIAGGGSPILVLGDVQPVREMFGQTDSIIPVLDTDELNALLAAQAILSPVAAMVSASAKWVARNGGDADKAEPFLRQLISSSLSGLASDDLISALNTPDGFNQRLRLFFEQNGLTASVDDGLSALSKDASDA